MQTHAEKQPQSRSETKKPGEGTFQFNDRRPETAALNRLQALADASPRVSQLRAMQAMADAGPQAARSRAIQAKADTAARHGAMPAAPAQLEAAEDEEALQGKFAPLQRQAAEDEEPLQGKFAPIQRAADEEEVQLKAGVPINDDPGLEHEADTMGAAALQRAASPSVARTDAAPLLGQSAPAQRQGSEEDEPLQGKFAPVQRAEAEDEDVQLKAANAPQAAMQRAEAAPRPNNTGLPDNLKSGIESLSGISLDNVKVHYNSDKPAQLNALAYAQGTDIHVGPGQEKHLPHEAWHVVQQAQGRVSPISHAKRGTINYDTSSERAPDIKGQKATRITDMFKPWILNKNSLQAINNSFPFRTSLQLQYDKSCSDDPKKYEKAVYERRKDERPRNKSCYGEAVFIDEQKNELHEPVAAKSEKAGKRCDAAKHAEKMVIEKLFSIAGQTMPDACKTQEATTPDENCKDKDNPTYATHSKTLSSSSGAEIGKAIKNSIEIGEKRPNGIKIYTELPPCNYGCGDYLTNIGNEIKVIGKYSSKLKGYKPGSKNTEKNNELWENHFNEIFPDTSAVTNTSSGSSTSASASASASASTSSVTNDTTSNDSFKKRTSNTGTEYKDSQFIKLSGQIYSDQNEKKRNLDGKSENSQHQPRSKKTKEDPPPSRCSASNEDEKSDSTDIDDEIYNAPCWAVNKIIDDYRKAIGVGGNYTINWSFSKEKIIAKYNEKDDEYHELISMSDDYWRGFVKYYNNKHKNENIKI